MSHCFNEYFSWDVSTVEEALETFEKNLKNGASKEEIQAGLRCLDFITVKTKLPLFLAEKVRRAEKEANLLLLEAA